MTDFSQISLFPETQPPSSSAEQQVSPPHSSRRSVQDMARVGLDKRELNANGILFLRSLRRMFERRIQKGDRHARYVFNETLKAEFFLKTGTLPATLSYRIGILSAL